MKTRAKTVLIVEDSLTQVLNLKQLLEEQGLQLLWAHNGQMAVLMAQQYMPDVILLDVEMPEMNGFEACKRLKENTRTAEIPTVMLTKLDDPASALRGMNLGAIDFIPKDAFSNTVLLETLRQLQIIDKTNGGYNVTL